MVGRLSCPAACGIFIPQPGIEATCPTSEGSHWTAKEVPELLQKTSAKRNNPRPPSTQQVPEVCGAFPSFFQEAGEDTSPQPDPPWKMSSVCWKEHDDVAVRGREWAREVCRHRLGSATFSSSITSHVWFLLHIRPSSLNPTGKHLGFAASLGLDFLRRAPWVTKNPWEMSVNAPLLCTCPVSI